MSKPLITVGDRVRALRQQLQLTQAEMVAAVRKVGGDLSQPQLSALENGLVSRPKALVEIATVLRTSPAALLVGAADSAPGELPSDTPRVLEHAVIAPGISFTGEMPRDVPVLGLISGVPGDLQTGSKARPIDWVRRPPRLAGRSDVFGAIVEELSMLPRYVPGELIFAERRPPQIGDFVIVEFKPTDDDQSIATVARLADREKDSITIEYLNPPASLVVAREKVANLYRVMPLMDLLGG